MIKDVIFFIIFYGVFFMGINKSHFIIGVFRSIDAVVGVFKANRFHLRSMMNNVFFGRILYWCFNVLVDVFASWFMYMILLNDLFSCWLSWQTMGPWKDIFPILHHDASIILSLTCCQVHIQNTFLVGTQLRGS